MINLNLPALVAHQFLSPSGPDDLEVSDVFELAAFLGVLDPYVSLVSSELCNPQSLLNPNCKREIRRYWYPTLQQMRCFVWPPGPDIAPCRLITVWATIGALFGLNEAQESNEYSVFVAQARRAFPRTKTKRCHWFNCACSDVRPQPAHPMRLCSGCQKVYYCGMKCQKRTFTGENVNAWRIPGKQTWSKHGRDRSTSGSVTVR
ncbi:hypothetical protein K474DRAFT_1044634 [Panus rudis PR-1116 ss-1]|nr:hypothetical protein K474DRAFT_1044634 [Panus rudis PR-1116 ss-1]